MESLRRRFLALSDETRLKVLLLLNKTDELCLCHLQELLGLAASTTSRHLQLLRDSGFVLARREGKWVHFRLDPENSKQWLELVLADPAARAMQTELETLKSSVDCSAINGNSPC